MAAHHRIATVIALGFLTCVASWSLGDSPAASQPTDSKHQDDRGTPKQAMQSLWTAILNGDAHVIAESLSTRTDEQAKAAREWANAIAAHAKLRKTVIAKFGKGPADAVPETVPTMDQIKAATVEESGDRATIHFPGASYGMEWVRSGANWRWSVLDELTDQNARMITEAVQKYAEQANQAVADVSSGKVIKPVDAEQLLKKFPFPGISTPHAAPQQVQTPNQKRQEH